MSSFTTLKLRAGLRKDCTPKTMYVTYDQGCLVAVYPEGVAGYKSITDRDHLSAWKGTAIPITPEQYDMYMELKTLLNL